MSEFKKMKIWLGYQNTPQLSIRVQLILFKLDYTWSSENDQVNPVNCTCLVTSDEGQITYSFEDKEKISFSSYYKDHTLINCEEITMQFLLDNYLTSFFK